MPVIYIILNVKMALWQNIEREEKVIGTCKISTMRVAACHFEKYIMFVQLPLVVFIKMFLKK